jgi:DNA end-binding protein Ku
VLWKNCTFLIVPSLSEGLALRVMSAGAVNSWPLVGEVRVTARNRGVNFLLGNARAPRADGCALAIGLSLRKEDSYDTVAIGRRAQQYPHLHSSTHSRFQFRNKLRMRAIWKGSISFGLVNIPIALYPATRKEELKFRLLRAKDLSPVNYKRVAEKDGKEVPWDDIVKGYEYEKGKYIVLKDEDFQRVDLEATQTVDIQDFVDEEEIDPMFFYKPYYLEPQKGGDKAYVLLRDTLAKTGKVGIAKVVIKTRQYLAGVKAEDSVLVLELMHFAEELADADKLHVPKKIEPGKRELDMAKALVDSMSSKWDPKKYRDDYREALMEVIEEKVEAGGKEIEEKPKPKPRPSTKVIDLVSVLQESLNKTQKSRRTRKSSAASRHRKAA